MNSCSLPPAMLESNDIICVLIQTLKHELKKVSDSSEIIDRRIVISWNDSKE